MAYLSVIGQCPCCGGMFSFNPYFVPVITYGGEKLPVCGDCISAANLERAENGAPLLQVHPMAYEPEECD